MQALEHAKRLFYLSTQQCHVLKRLSKRSKAQRRLNLSTQQSYHVLTSLRPSLRKISVHFLHSWATAATSIVSAKSTSSSLVDFHHDGIHNSLELLLPCLEFILFRQLILVEPIQCLLDSLLDLVLVITFELVLELLLLQSVALCEAVILQAVLSLDLGFVLLIFSAILFCLLHHAVNL